MLPATSVADDLGFVALGDMARAADGLKYRLIGGHMLMMLVARWNLGPELYRETRDADLGIPPLVASDSALVEALLELEYQQTAGDRFERLIDFPGMAPQTAVIDVLVPATTSRARTNRRHGEHLVVTEALGLATALKREAIEMHVEMHRLEGQVIEADLLVPDEVAAVTLKAFATRVRNRPTDVVDVWRCLEVALSAGCTPGDFDAGEPLEAAAIVRELFGRRQGSGMAALENELRLSQAALDVRFTRLRALIDRVLGQTAR